MYAQGVTLHGKSIMLTGRSIPKIDEALKPTLEKIRANAEKRLVWLKIIFPVAKNLWKSMTPKKVFYIFSFGLVAGYIEYLLTRGIFAGIAVDNDTYFPDLFSSTENTSLQVGLNLTNADQAGQFAMDGCVLGFLTFNFLLREPYNKLATIVKYACFKPYLNELQMAIDEAETQLQTESEENESQFAYLIKCREELNRLYEHLEEELKAYGTTPILCEESTFLQQDEEVQINEQTTQIEEFKTDLSNDEVADEV